MDIICLSKREYLRYLLLVEIPNLLRYHSSSCGLIPMLLDSDSFPCHYNTRKLYCSSNILLMKSQLVWCMITHLWLVIPPAHSPIYSLFSDLLWTIYSLSKIDPRKTWSCASRRGSPYQNVSKESKATTSKFSYY